MFCNFFSPSTFNFGISLGRPRSRLRLSGERAHAARARLRYSDILGADLSLRRTHENRQLIYPLRQPPPPQAENEKQSNQFIGADDFRRHFHIWNRSIILSQFWRQRKESHLFFHEIMRGLCIYPLSDRILGVFFFFFFLGSRYVRLGRLKKTKFCGLSQDGVVRRFGSECGRYTSDCP